METCDPVGTPLEIKDKLDLDQNRTLVDATKYCSMIGALTYLTSSRLDIVHATCLCARYQAKPIEKHLKEAKRIFYADYAGCKDTFKSTFGEAQFLGEKLVSWSSKKQDYYDFHFNKIPIYCDLKSAIAISCNPVQHSRTKHIAVRYHFIKEHVEKGMIELYFVKTDYQLADLITKALLVDRFNYLVRRLDVIGEDNCDDDDCDEEMSLMRMSDLRLATTYSIICRGADCSLNLGLERHEFIRICHRMEKVRTINHSRLLMLRFAKLINDMRNIKMTMSKIQLNSKFVNNMLPEWGRFVTAVKLNKGLKDSNFDQLYAYLKQHEAHANENKIMVVVQNVQGRQNRGQGNNARGAGAVGYGRAQNRVGNANPGQARQVNVEDAKAQENGVVLDEEQLLFLAGGQDNAIDEDVDEQPVQDLALNVDNVFQADDCDAYDSDVDEAPTAQTMFMANLSSADPVCNEAGPSYDSDVLSEVHDHDHYQDAICDHHEEHEMHDDVQPNHVVDSHADYTSDSNMTPYDQYVLDNDVHESDVLSVSHTPRNTVANNLLNAELPNKELVELYVRTGKQLATRTLCLHRARQAQPALYSGHVIVTPNHAPAVVRDGEETLELTEISRKKMHDKMKANECVDNKVNITPPNYSKENFLATFTSQKQLTPEQIFWSQDIVKMKAEALKEQNTRPIKALTVYPPNTPATLVPRVLPTKSQILKSPSLYPRVLPEQYDVIESTRIEDGNLLEPTSNKLLGILLKMNLPDHRPVLTDPEAQVKMEMVTPRSSGVNSPPNVHT
ncbi:hypothetical protein Tco_0299382 [Tanacetum coccineum]